MDRIFLVALGGAVGAVARHIVATGMKSAWPAYAESGTLLVNLVGSLAIGFLLGTTAETRSISESSRLLLVTGFLGGLTTFSSLAHETADLTAREGGLTAGLFHLSANVVLGLTAVWIGVWLRR
jgi:fluoride exporter